MIHVCYIDNAMISFIVIAVQPTWQRQRQQLLGMECNGRGQSRFRLRHVSFNWGGAVCTVEPRYLGHG